MGAMHREKGKSCKASLFYLESKDSTGLESQVGLEVLSNLTHQPLERQLADEQLSGLLILADLTQSDSSWPIPAIGRSCISFCDGC